MYFKTLHPAHQRPTGTKRLRILAQIALSAFTLIACIGAFHHLNMGAKGGTAHAAAVQTAPSMEAYHTSHLRKSRSAVRSLAKRIYKKPEAIKGQAVANLVQIFYQPELVRTEGPMVLWQYRNDTCVMDVYFEAQDGASGAEKVHYVETRFRDPALNTQEASTKTCVHSLLKTSSAPRMVDVSSIFKL